jgi:hypothetical protein
VVVAAVGQVLELEQVPEPQGWLLGPLCCHSQTLQALVGWKRVGLQRVRWLVLPRAAMQRPALDPTTFCIRRRAVLPTALWRPETVFDDS